MNCRPGDTAVIIRSLAGNEGALVRVVDADVVRLPGWKAYGSLRLWHCEALTSTREGVEGVGLVVEWPAGDHFSFPDAWLRPIRPQDDDAIDETLLWLPVPTKETA